MGSGSGEGAGWGLRGSAAELLPMWSIFEVTETQEESAESRDGRTYRFESQLSS